MDGPTAGVVVATVIQWFAAFNYDIREFTVVCALAVAAVAIVAPSLRFLAIGAFLVGASLDFVLQLYSRWGAGNGWARSTALLYYFNDLGSLVSMVLGGALTAIMIMTAVIIAKTLDKGGDVHVIAIAGFMVGVVWGVGGHDARAMRTFRPFYDATSGYIESRFWDGISITLAIYILHLATLYFPGLNDGTIFFDPVG